MQKKFKKLRSVAGFYQFLSILIVIAGGIIAVLSVLVSTMRYDIATNSFVEGPPQFGVAVGIMVASVFMALGVFVLSELIMVFLAIEENTRLTSMAVSKLAKKRDE